MKIIETGDGSKTLFSEHYQQTYHSTFGAETESRQVYLEASGCAAKLDSGDDVKILEIGFGLGLNFFISAEYALQTKARLYYTACENNLLPLNELRQLDYDSQLASTELVTSVLNQLEKRLNNLEKRDDSTVSIAAADNVHLQLLLGDATEQRFGAIQFDAIYLDPFSKEYNAECWSTGFLSRLAKSLKPGSSMTTYAANGTLKRNLQLAGLQVHKQKGPPGKREITVATQPANL